MLACLLRATAAAHPRRSLACRAAFATQLARPSRSRSHARVAAMASAAPLRFSVGVDVDVEGVILAARDAAAVILSIYEGEASAWETEQKADSSPLTRADKEANALICGAWARVCEGET